MSKKVVLTQLNELELVRDYLNGDMAEMEKGNSSLSNNGILERAEQIKVRGGLLERITETIKSFNLPQTEEKVESVDKGESKPLSSDDKDITIIIPEENE